MTMIDTVFRVFFSIGARSGSVHPAAAKSAMTRPVGLFSNYRIAPAIFASCLLFTLTAHADEPPESFTQTFTHSGGEYHVDFSRCSVRSSNFEIYDHQGGVVYAPFTTLRPARTYLGTVQELPGAVAAGQLLDDGSLRTSIIFEDGTTWRGTGSSITVPAPASWTPKYPSSLIGANGAGSNIFAAEVGLDLTYTYFNQASHDIAEAVERAEWSVMETNAIYLRDVAIFHKIGRIIVRTNSSDDRSTTLSLLKNEWQTVLPTDLPGSNHALAASVVVTGSGGLAWVGSVATANRYAWNSIRSSSSDGSFCVVWRHEAGHNWGAGHSEGGAPEGSTIMSGNGLSRFSSSDLAAMVSHRNSRPAGALDVLGPWPIDLPPRANADRGRALISGAATIFDVLNNDSDSNGDAISLLSFDTTTQRGGSVARIPATITGERDRLAYLADPSFTSGIDWFTYRIEDASGLQSVAYVMILPAPQEPDDSIIPDVASIADGAWTAPEVWDNSEAASTNHDYGVSPGTTVDTPASGNLIFPGDSLRVTGTLRLRHTSGGGNTTQTIDLKSLILDDGATLQSYNTSAGNVYRTLHSPISVPSGDTTIRIQSDSGSAYTNSLVLDGGLFGSGNIQLTGSLQGQSGERRKLQLNLPGSTYSGNWSVVGDGTSDTSRRLFLIANAAGALGTGNVTLGSLATLRNSSPEGLDSLSTVNLTTATSTLDLVEPWINPSATLILGNGHMNLGDGHNRVGDLQIGGVSLDHATYSVADLNSLASNVIFSGTGTLSVGQAPPEAISITDGAWTSASTWSNGVAAPTTGTQGEGITYLIEGFMVSSNDPLSNQQALIGSQLRVGNGGVLDLARLNSGTNVNVYYDLPPTELQDGGSLHFRASIGSSSHHLAAPLSFTGSTALRIKGGNYSNNVTLSGSLTGDGTIALISDSNAVSSTGNVRTFSINSPDNSFTGNWTVAHTATGDDYTALTTHAANALGSGTVTISTRARLINNSANGLDSLTEIVLNNENASLVSHADTTIAALSGTAGSLIVSGGTLSITTASIPDSTDVKLTSGATLNLNFSGTDTIREIYIDGIAQSLSGTWGSLTSDADHKTALISGPGLLYLAPSTTAFEEWAAIEGLTGAPGFEAGFTDDPDSDGYANGFEWILGGNPLSQDNSSLLTTTATPSGDLILTFTREESSIGISSLTVEWDTDLSDGFSHSIPIHTEAISTGDTPIVEIDTNPTPDAVSVTIPAANAVSGKIFARLKATHP